jgi:Spy/CpxP family protein refolding chaperone
MRSMSFLAALCVMALLAATALAASPSPYAGQETRELKALSPQEIDDLEKGRGMGLARTAELNGYPGPKHVLELAAELGLDAEQHAAVKALEDRMYAAARPLGATILEHERALDRQFAAGTANASDLAAKTEAIGQLYGRLRAVHLEAHLATKAALRPEQVARYNELRGYGAPVAPAMHDHAKMHGG